MANEPEADSHALTFKIPPEDSGRRLDSFLASKIESSSRARLQQLIESEDILVNGKPSKSSYKVRENDEIEVELVQADSSNFVPENIPLDIVYEDDALVVINKPAGLVVHPAAGISSGTLANALAYHFQQLPTVSGKARPGIVHRLDRDTSGLLVVAKTDFAVEHLGNQFRNREMFKSYVALVHGRVAKDSERIEQPIARDPRNRTKMAVIRGGRGAVSIYHVRKRFQRFTLLDVQLLTGRTHQIRVHLAWIKHPVVGDETYGGGRDNTVQDARLRARIRNLGRHFLHAERLGFVHPSSGEKVEFKAPLPDELAELLQEITSTDLQDVH